MRLEDFVESSERVETKQSFVSPLPDSTLPAELGSSANGFGRPSLASRIRSYLFSNIVCLDNTSSSPNNGTAERS